MKVSIIRLSGGAYLTLLPSRGKALVCPFCGRPNMLVDALVTGWTGGQDDLSPAEQQLYINVHLDCRGCPNTQSLGAWLSQGKVRKPKA